LLNTLNSSWGAGFLAQQLAPNPNFIYSTLVFRSKVEQTSDFIFNFGLHFLVGMFQEISDVGVNFILVSESFSELPNPSIMLDKREVDDNIP